MGVTTLNLALRFTCLCPIIVNYNNEIESSIQDFVAVFTAWPHRQTLKSSKMIGTTRPMTEHHFPENFNLQQWHCDNLKSCTITVYYTVTDNKPNVCQSQYFPNFHKIHNKTGPATFRSYFILTTHQSQGL